MKKILFVILAMLCLMLCGCDGGEAVRGTHRVDMTIYGAVPTIDFFYAVDEKTGVVYIIGIKYRKGFMSVALNADGTPVTKEQLLNGE